jgi:paraquat-inducible protein B
MWLIPIVAAGLVLYLGYSALADRGPIVTLVMATADGLTVDQTEVKHKAVTVGTVTGIKLSPDAKTVLVQVRMVGGSEAMYTDAARFWVVRPRLSAGSLTGIETLVSGAYVEVDPGAAGGKKQLQFTALRQPPGRQSDEPGQVYVLAARHLGSLGTGSPVYYRDVEVGQVLSYELGAGLGPVTLRVFVREPFDEFVHAGTQFWNASGLSLTVGADGMRVVLQSLQTLLSGGIAFETPSNDGEDAASPEGARFELYDDKAAADDAFYQQRIPYVTYFRSSVQGLSSGSPVQISGVRVGSVSDVRLVYDPDARAMVARVAFDLQPQRILSKNAADQARATVDVVKAFSGSTMRVTLESSNLLTGTRDLSIEYGKGGAGAAPLDAREGEARVLPSEAGGIDSLTASLADVASKVDKIPFAKIGDNTNATLASIQRLVDKIDATATPALEQLPGVMAQVSDAARSANGVLGASGYGQDSEFQHDLARMMREMGDTARSFRSLSDYLDRHPEALLRGRASQETAH